MENSLLSFLFRCVNMHVGSLTVLKDCYSKLLHLFILICLKLWIIFCKRICRSGDFLRFRPLARTPPWFSSFSLRWYITLVFVSLYFMFLYILCFSLLFCLVKFFIPPPLPIWPGGGVISVKWSDRSKQFGPNILLKHRTSI